MVQGPLLVDARSPHGISVKDEVVIQKLMPGLVLSFHTPRVMSLQSLGMKRGGVEFIMASCILLASLM